MTIDPSHPATQALQCIIQRTGIDQRLLAADDSRTTYKVYLRVGITDKDILSYVGKSWDDVVEQVVSAIQVLNPAKPAEPEHRPNRKQRRAWLAQQRRKMVFRG